VLGILNVTPDSFSDGGAHLDLAVAVAATDAMLEQGADMIDVGGESSRPGAHPVSTAVQIARVVPVIEAIADRCVVSIDTRDEAVARAAVDAGAVIINDISASLAEVAAELGSGWIAMHMQGEPRTMQTNPAYGSVVDEVLGFLVERADRARAIGVEDVWIDPGFGFGKTLEHNLALLAATDRFVATGHPVAVGISRKGTLGKLLAASDGVDRVGPDDRLEGSVAAACSAVRAGARLIRSHDVGPTVAALGVVGAEASAERARDDQSG
jgi:dihydropteroate synthase